MAPPVVSLIVRGLTVVCLLISLIILTTNTTNLTISFTTVVKIRFNDVYSYRYMVAATVIGLAYTLLQLALTVSLNRQGATGIFYFDFYGDKVISYMLATGAAAGFGATIDLKPVFSGIINDKFFNKGNAAASVLLIGFLFSAISSVFSALALPKRQY